LRTLKIVLIITLVAASVGFILSDTTASEINGVTNRTVSKDSEPRMTSVKLNEIGIMTASWYGPKFHGRLTANGERYDQMGFTAAHKSLPFGTVLQITNLRNGKSVLIRINDRGPFIEGRDLDLSKGTALALGMIEKGIIKVKAEEIILSSDKDPVNTLN
jgi:rare lipoprotein A